MVTTFRVYKHVKNNTYVIEFWDNIPVMEYKVLAPYYGGDIKVFIEKNPANRRPLFDGLGELLQINNVI